MPDASATPRGRGRPSTGAREAVLAAARSLFGERGYDAVTTEDVLIRSGVSRGAMYHHFEGKLELFRAVYVEVEREAMERMAVAAAGGGGGPLDQLTAGCRAYLRACAKPSDWRRIALLESRQVLGWEGWRDVARHLGIAALTGAVAGAVQAGEIESGDVAVTSQLLLASLVEGGLLVATSAQPERTRRAVERQVVRLLEGLRPTAAATA
jgi:AcrR family transcriptional regulator